MATRIVGLDIGSKTIRALVLEAGFRSFEVIEAFEEPVVEPAESDVDVESMEMPPPHPEEIKDHEEFSQSEEDASEGAEEVPTTAPILTTGQLQAINRIDDRGLLESDRIYTNFPESLVYFTELSLPFSDPKEISAVLAPQLDGRLPVDTDELLLDFIKLGKRGDENFIYAGGAREEDVGDYLSFFQQSGLDPRVFDVSPAHLWSAVNYLTQTEEESNEAKAYIDFGANHTRIVVYRGDHLELCRTIHDGGELITERLADGLSMTEGQARAFKHKSLDLSPESEPADADQIRGAEIAREALRPLIRDIKRTLQSHAQQYHEPITRLYIGGGAGQLRGLRELFNEMTGILPEQLPFDGSTYERVRNFDQDKANHFVGALGLALRGTSVEPVSTFNLRKGPFEFRGNYAFITERFGAIAWLAALLLVGFTVYLVGQSTLLRKEYEAVQEGLATVTEHTFGHAIRKPEVVMSRLQRGVSDSTIMPEYSAFDVMIEIGQAVVATQDEQFFAETDAIEINMQRATIRIGGKCESAKAADVLASKLSEQRCLHDINRTSLSEARSGSGFEFAFQAAINCREEPQNEEDS